MDSEALKRYHRHIILPEFGLEAQEKLNNSSVLVVGAGGLGCPVLQYLVAAGVGRIGIVDGDTIDVSNLQRQTLYSEQDVGRLKAEVAAEKLKGQNSLVRFEVYKTHLSSSNALEIVDQYDLVVDGTDNFPARYLINDACEIKGKPFVYGSIYKFEGQVSVFNFGGGPSYRCLFPEPPSPGQVPNCSEIGVIGVLPGLIGTMQASEALKILSGVGDPLSGKLMMLNTLTMESHIISFQRNTEAAPVTELIDYEDFCGTNKKRIKEVEPAQLKRWMDAGEIRVLDVREHSEAGICKITDWIIPLGELENNLPDIGFDERIVVHCHHGGRSAKAVEVLESKGYNNAYNLVGGIHAWSTDVDDSVPVY